MTDAMRARFAQIDAERAAKREFFYANPREAVKRLRKRVERKHAAWRDKESYGKGVALQLTLGTSADDDAAEGGLAHRCWSSTGPNGSTPAARRPDQLRSLRRHTGVGAAGARGRARAVLHAKPEVG